MMENSKEPAFPVIQKTDATGITKREYFAAMAMQGILASSWGKRVTAEGKADIMTEQVSAASIACAEHLLTQLEKK